MFWLTAMRSVSAFKSRKPGALRLLKGKINVCFQEAVMKKVTFLPLPSDHVKALRSGGRDAYGCLPERTISDGKGNPCRHCPGLIPKGAGMLILACRPFDELQPHAETGPIFLCADECQPWAGDGLPPMLESPDYLLKGYTADQRIRYGTGKIVAKDEISSCAAELLACDDISFVDVRSARNNCFQTRIVRAS
ncbi:DUF1203 domain-containing protein [Paracoccus kondratievae]|uniref:DUF1203 domain-containing protein n=1 Tax=Paracoccus kondratievae TaxID=135740 RepID=UPI0012666626|nr:DUF1203 domain-containing protein [Paracoccus kondratievae]QFQ86279.1 DUF1203 domain-containing protein [Paracoccus kondratievae]